VLAAVAVLPASATSRTLLRMPPAIPKARTEAVPRSNFRITVRTVILPRAFLATTPKRRHPQFVSHETVTIFEHRPRPTLAPAGATAVRISTAVAGARRAIHGRQTPAPRMKPYRGPPMTLGNAAAAMVRLIIWCRDCGRQVEPDPAEMAERSGAETTVPEWCSLPPPIRPVQHERMSSPTS
jgi:hypothetical protein